MAQQTAADDSTELRMGDEVDEITQIEAKRIFEAVDCNVTVNGPNYNDECHINVWWNSDESVNGYHKATVINNVLESAASVTLHGTRDGDTAVTFVAN